MPKIVSRISLQQEKVGFPVALPQNFVVKRGLEGLQIVISWESKESADAIRLVRKRGSFPESIDDGKVLLEESPPASNGYIDLDLKDRIIFYYTLFYKKKGETSYTLDKSLRGKAFSSRETLMQDKLFSLLPGIYKREDQESAGSSHLFFSPEVDTKNNNEIRKLNIDTEKSYGELQRFLMIFGTLLSDAKVLIDRLPFEFDVDEADSDFLPHIASLLGITFNYDISIPRQREEIKKAVKTFQEKGTINGILNHVDRITGLTSNLQEMYNNVLYSNDKSSTSLDFSKIDITKQHGLYGDTIDYSMDFRQDSHVYSMEVLSIYIYIGPNESFSSATAKKLARTIREHISADTVARFFLVDKETEKFIYSGDAEVITSTISGIATDYPITLDNTLFANDWLRVSMPINGNFQALEFCPTPNYVSLVIDNNLNVMIENTKSSILLEGSTNPSS